MQDRRAPVRSTAKQKTTKKLVFIQQDPPKPIGQCPTRIISKAFNQWPD